MDTEELARLERILERRAADLEEALARPTDQTPAVAPDNAIGRLTRVDAMQAGYMSEALRRQQAEELARIKRALQSLAEGSYGRCRRCGEPLSLARLEARPDAHLCVACASARER